MSKKILVTGAAGFIGSHLSEALCARGDRVVGLDSFDAYYDPARKHENITEVRASCRERFTLVEGDVRDRELTATLFARERFDAVVHLAALAGVRASIGEAQRYFDVNLMGTVALLDACVRHAVPHFVFASTSSVYGDSDKLPFVDGLPGLHTRAPGEAPEQEAFNAKVINYQHPDHDTAVWPAEERRHD